MPKSRSRSNKIDIPVNERIRLRVQPDYPLDENDIIKLNALYNKAIKFIGIAFNELDSFSRDIAHLHQDENIHETTQARYKFLLQMLQKHFNINNNIPAGSIKAYVKLTHDSLVKIRDGLYSQDKLLYIANISHHKNPSPLTSLQITKGYIHPEVNDTLYVTLNDINDDPDSFLDTLIHEASHLFVKTLDLNTWYHIEQGYFAECVNNLISYFTSNLHVSSLNNCSPPTRIAHAASISNFVCELGHNATKLYEQGNTSNRYCERPLVGANIHGLFKNKKPRITTTGALEFALVTEIVALAGVLAYKYP